MAEPVQPRNQRRVLRSPKNLPQRNVENKPNIPLQPTVSQLGCLPSAELSLGLAIETGEQIVDDKTELQWRYLKDNLDHSRHHETLRATTTNAILVLAGAGFTVVGYDKCVQAADIPVLLFVALIGLFGALFVAKQTERADAHYERARDLRDEIDRSAQPPGFARLRAISDSRHKDRYKGVGSWLRWQGLRNFWIALHLLVTALAVGLVWFAANVVKCAPG